MPLSFNRLMTLVETCMSIVKISIIFKIDLERFISTSSDCGLKKNALQFFASMGVKKKNSLPRVCSNTIQFRQS